MWPRRSHRKRRSHPPSSGEVGRRPLSERGESQPSQPPSQNALAFLLAPTRSAFAFNSDL
uniref:Uncharacterized protein n=1 Tax=uncultured marine virus TaxID=186617 RepID=A0A0F7L926_9VIRU|nr:hypothetical protein [uncultured marine virus]